ncbi:hypothetical protein BLNAU_6948 [Blattamonas nauphoetae]|uniref:Uncharacterized protein n=1 Tax=Blattamonas nauphoetae TaxID=2049346 RepID=A0ABQ9Y2Q0_9EUKA|nr:hypothetical protein BLNAU_6948 [Blattamonas nauphoetae]
MIYCHTLDGHNLIEFSIEHDMMCLSQADAIHQSQAPDSGRVFVKEHEPFLNFDPESTLSFEDKSTIYNSLVAFVKAGYPFDNALQDKAAQFLKSLEPRVCDTQQATKLVTDLVPSSSRSPSDFIESILTLVSSPYSIVVSSALKFQYQLAHAKSLKFKLHLVESDLITNILAIVQPHTLPITGNETIINQITKTDTEYLYLGSRSSLRTSSITSAADRWHCREMIFQKVILPSSQFLTFLISNRLLLNGDLFDSFIALLGKLLEISPFHGPTLEFVLASPVVMAFSSCLALVELNEWKNSEVVQSGKRMTQALLSEDFESMLEQMLMREKDGHFCVNITIYCRSISKLLGENVQRR